MKEWYITLLRKHVWPDIYWKTTHDGQCMADGLMTQSADQLRHLFVLLLLYCDIGDPVTLYIDFREAMADDICYNLQKSENEIVELNDSIFRNHYRLSMNIYSLMVWGNRQ